MEYMSTDISKLAEALAKAQGIMRGAKEDTSNTFFKSKYADLTSVWEACRESLSSNGLSVCQMIDSESEKMRLITILMHSSGQWVKSFMPIIPKQMTVQDVGSAMTYARRYALAAIVGVCPEDDDGEKAMGREKSPHMTDKKQYIKAVDTSTGELAMEPEYITEEQVNEILTLIGDDSKLYENVLKAYGIKTFNKLPKDKGDVVIKKLRLTIEERKKANENP